MNVNRARYQDDYKKNGAEGISEHAHTEHRHMTALAVADR